MSLNMKPIELDKSFEIPVYPEQCTFCQNYIGMTTNKTTFEIVHSCKAYPKRIPREILLNKIIHTTPYKGDHGILFKKIEK